eukprot:11326639-Alexandrium_andersonii.AAC.1
MERREKAMGRHGKPWIAEQHIMDVHGEAMECACKRDWRRPMNCQSDRSGKAFDVEPARQGQPR